MRTVTFSDRRLAAEINARFACAWVNRKPQETFPNFRPLSARESLGLPLWAGVTNVTSVFATPDGAVLNAVPGFLEPVRFRDEAEFALDLDRWGLEAYEERHRARAAEYAGRKPSPDETRLPIGARAHLKLAKAGVQRLGEMKLTLFDEYSPRMTECRVQKQFDRK